MLKLRERVHDYEPALLALVSRGGFGNERDVHKA